MSQTKLLKTYVIKFLWIILSIINYKKKLHTEFKVHSVFV